MALALVLIPVSTLDAFALNADAEPKEDKIICTATLEDEFAEDEVVLSLLIMFVLLGVLFVVKHAKDDEHDYCRDYKSYDYARHKQSYRPRRHIVVNNRSTRR